MIGKHVSKTRLSCELLEDRNLMAVIQLTYVNVPIVNPDGSSAMIGAGMPIEAAALAGAGLTLQQYNAPLPLNTVIANVTLSANSISSAPANNSGVGQMTITTGANTPGIGSFAAPIVNSRL